MGFEGCYKKLSLFFPGLTSCWKYKKHTKWYNLIYLSVSSILISRLLLFTRRERSLNPNLIDHLLFHIIYSHKLFYLAAVSSPVIFHSILMHLQKHTVYSDDSTYTQRAVWQRERVCLIVCDLSGGTGFSCFSLSVWMGGCRVKILLTCPWAWKPQTLCVFHARLEIKGQRRKKRI